MKTKRSLPLSGFVLAGLCLRSAGSAAVAEKSAADSSGEAKPFVLFMGVDLAVQRDRQYHQVKDVSGSEFMIRIGKREYFVPTRRKTTDLKVNNSLKLSGATVTLDGLQSGPAYTTANDPVRKFNAASGSAGGAAAMQDLAQGQVAQVATATEHAIMVAEANPGIEAAQVNAANFRVQLADTMRNEATVGHMARYDSQNNAAVQADRMKGELAEGGHDAMEVSFKVSSPVELDDPYMIILFKFQEREAKPGEEGLLIHAASLDPIGPNPKYIRVREAGLPVGFKYLDCEVHIYNRGQEIATNVSPKRVALTRAEAQEYLVIEYLGTNKGATVPAGAVPGTLPLAQRKQLSLDQLNRAFYAKVAPDGSVLGVFLDQGCQQRLEDAAALAVIGEVFFRPALDQGKPREGVARFRLAELIL